MSYNIGLVERAFQLARLGYCENLKALRLALHSEGFSNFEIDQVDAPTLRKQLRALLAAKPNSDAT